MAVAQPRVIGLRALREEAGLSRRDFSIALHEKGLEYTEAAIYKLEQGRSKRGTSVLRAGVMADVLSAHLGRPVGIDDLFPRSGQQVAPDQLAAKQGGNRSNPRSKPASSKKPGKQSPIILERLTCAALRASGEPSETFQRAA